MVVCSSIRLVLLWPTIILQLNIEYKLFGLYQLVILSDQSGYRVVESFGEVFNWVIFGEFGIDRQIKNSPI